MMKKITLFWLLVWFVHSETRLFAQSEVKEAHVAAIYVCPRTGSVEGNIAAVRKQIDLAADDCKKKGRPIDIIVLAEMAAYRWLPGTMREKAEPEYEGPFFKEMQKAASEHQCYIAFNLDVRRKDGNLYRTIFLVGRTGELIGKYDKVNVPAEELKGGIIPGADDETNVRPIETEFGRIGMLICFDVDKRVPCFPETIFDQSPTRDTTKIRMMKRLVDAGAQLVLVSSIGDYTGMAVEDAKDNQVWVVHAGIQAYANKIYPKAMIVKPDGSVLAGVGTAEEVGSNGSDTFTGYSSIIIPLGAIMPIRTFTFAELHRGDLEADTKLLDSYGLLPDSIRDFYLQARAYFVENRAADFTDSTLIALAGKNNLPLMGGPMLGQLNAEGVTLWLRPSTADPLVVHVTKAGSSEVKSVVRHSPTPGLEQRIVLNGLAPDTEYNYTVYTQERRIAEGRFVTAPSVGSKGIFRLAFGSCAHKKGVHNPNLFHQILSRKPHVMMILGDFAVDDRDNRIPMHRSDYLLRDVSQAWRHFSSQVPVYAAWDDHDYFNDDLAGVPEKFTANDREALRAVWQQNWNNPDNKKPGIYFNTRIGPVEMIMLDTRSCRENARRGQYGSFLGAEQMKWLKGVLKKSKAPFKVISSGTMWTDYITNGKDSWGTWDIKAREELFNYIETERISGVLLISGDRHGARGFTIPRPSGFVFHEFEAGSLGGMEGPPAMAENAANQLFGYLGRDFIAFGEFTFDTQGDTPSVTFRLINEYGQIIEEHY